MLFRNDLLRLWPLMSADGDPPAAPAGGPPAGGTPPAPPAAAAPPAAPGTPPVAPAAPGEPGKPGGTLLGGEPATPADPAGKPGESPPAPPAELKVEDLKAPEGFKVSPDILGELVGVMNKPDMTPQQRTQALVDMHARIVKEVAEQPQRLWNDTNTQWKKEIASDKDYGSGNPESPIKPEVLAQAAQVIDRYGGPELRTALDITGAGNNPAVVRFIAKIAPALIEGKFIPGGGAAVAPKTPAQAMYPDLPSAAGA